MMFMFFRLTCSLGIIVSSCTHFVAKKKWYCINMVAEYVSITHFIKSVVLLRSIPRSLLFPCLAECPLCVSTVICCGSRCILRFWVDFVLSCKLGILCTSESRSISVPLPRCFDYTCPVMYLHVWYDASSFVFVA